MTDLLAEMAFGKGAIKVLGKILLFNQDSYNLNGKEIKRTIILGCVVGNLAEKLEIDDTNINEIMDKSHEMWEVEMIIIPKRKYRGSKEKQESLGGLDAGQILETNWSNRERYKEQFFP